MRNDIFGPFEISKVKRLARAKVFAYVGLPQNLKDVKAGAHGLSTEQFPVSAYVGSSKNLKDLKAIRRHKCFLCSPFYGRACRWAIFG